MKKYNSQNYCAPSRIDNYINNKTCYTIKELQKIAKNYNKTIAKTDNDIIPLNISKNQLYNNIKQKLKRCKNEICWNKLLDDNKKKDIFKLLIHNRQFKTAEINYILKQFESIPEYNFKFLGTFPLDINPLKNNPLVNNNIGIVFNLDPSDQPGSHWVGLFKSIETPDIFEYFDSFGDKPPKEIINYLSNYQVIYNNREIQKNSKVACGAYTIFFIISRLKGKSFKEFVDSRLNDNIIKNKRKEFMAH